MIFSINSGLLEACVLALLMDGDSYGYKLTQELKAMAGISDSTLYPVLKRLLKDGYVNSYNKEFDGRNRKYYTITAVGKRQHLSNIEEWKDYRALLNKFFKG